MKFLVAVVLSVLFISCVSKKHTVVLKTQLYHPYCGGAAPTPEQMKGYYTPMDKSIVLVRTKDTVEVSGQNGEAILKLREGAYQWFQSAKFMKTTRMYALLSSLGENFTVEDMSCIDSWKKTPDGAFNVSAESDTVFLTLRLNCYTKLMPCIKYVGPKYQ